MSVLIRGRINEKSFCYEYFDVDNIYDALIKIQSQEGINVLDAQYIDFVNDK